MKEIIAPAKYSLLSWQERVELRNKYISQQDGNCFYCGNKLVDSPPKRITDKPIDWSLFPSEFMKYPVHLQHNHKTGLTEGAVHAYCNAIMWQYEGR